MMGTSWQAREDRGFDNVLLILAECSALLRQVDPALDFIPMSTQTRHYAVVGRHGVAIDISPEGRNQPLRLEARKDRNGDEYLKISARLGSLKAKWRDELVKSGFEVLRREDSQRSHFLAIKVYNAPDFLNHRRLWEGVFRDSLHSGGMRDSLG